MLMGRYPFLFKWRLWGNFWWLFLILHPTFTFPVKYDFYTPLSWTPRSATALGCINPKASPPPFLITLLRLSSFSVKYFKVNTSRTADWILAAPFLSDGILGARNEMWQLWKITRATNYLDKEWKLSRRFRPKVNRIRSRRLCADDADSSDKSWVISWQLQLIINHRSLDKCISMGDRSHSVRHYGIRNLYINVEELIPSVWSQPLFH